MPLPARHIDLNCDLGESESPGQIAVDEALLGIVTSASIACGGHAGDEASMRRTVRAAMARGVAIGAHPSYPDRAGFGRVSMKLTPAEVEQTVFEQVSALAGVCREVGARLVHLKPHGALYHDAMRDAEIARAVARGGHRALRDRDLVHIGQAGTDGLDIWVSLGCRVAAEAFADRRYEPDGTLRSRTLAGAVLADPAEAAAQAVRIALGQGAIASDGSVIGVDARTICLHSDTPGAADVARAVREGLVRAAVDVRHG